MRLIFLLLLFISLNASAQHPITKQFSKSDTLRGAQNPERTVYDITYYHLDIKVNPTSGFVSGKNLFKFTATRNFNKLQFDLFDNMEIKNIWYKNQSIPYEREYNAVFITFPKTILAGSIEEFTVEYYGNPIVAKNAPWDGGLVFDKDEAGNPWMGVAVQGIGASTWWPSKDQQADQVDSMKISITVPDSLMNISNGQFLGKEPVENGYMRYNWFVSYPINHYNVTMNIGKYAHVSDEYNGENGKLAIDYYVLPENLEKAKKQFANNVPAMLSCFEHWFGPYPFYRDGYKLIESSYLGMEHQSAVAYGNQYENGYLKRDISGSGFGLDWDFIIIHESGHEWFGNNITAKDIADAWIHEGFTTYAEAIFVECKHGKKAAEAYVKGLRRGIQNREPIVGKRGVDHSGGRDIYNKGANILQTIRTVINNDDTWRAILRGLNSEFHLKTVDSDDVIKYISKKSGRDFSAIFDGYLNYAAIPVLETRKIKDGIEYRWNSPVKGFNLPIRIKTTKEKDWKLHEACSNWRKIKSKDTLLIDTDAMYFTIKNL